MSYFSWLDYSEHERRKVLDVVDSFREQDTRDELGIGAIRDAFADMLFPGTSTIETRARYFLLIAWVYQNIERTSTSRGSAARARRDEIALIRPLLDSDDCEGTIGGRAQARLQRLPSTVYWLGLERWGIRLFHGSQDQYHRWLDALGADSRRVLRNDDGEPVEGSVPTNWHGGLPKRPPDFPKGISFRLTVAEAEYLRERIITRCSGTLLAFLVDRGHSWQPVSFPWEHPQLAEFPVHVREQLEHAHCFSEVVHGAALLYNLMLAEAQLLQERSATRPPGHLAPPQTGTRPVYHKPGCFGAGDAPEWTISVASAARSSSCRGRERVRSTGRSIRERRDRRAASHRPPPARVVLATDPARVHLPALLRAYTGGW